MIRGSTAAHAAHAFILVSKSKGAAFQRRLTAGAASRHTAGGSRVAPQWVRLRRTGNVITAAVSADGASWTTVGSDTFDLPALALIGLAVTSHDMATLATATFDDVRVDP
jgi:hypothetical protein